MSVQRTLRLWQRSGLSVRAFCEQQDLSQPSFYAWRRTLAERDAQAVTFVPAYGWKGDFRSARFRSTLALVAAPISTGHDDLRRADAGQISRGRLP